MDTKAIFVFWHVGMREPDRLLDDLAEWTDIDTVVVGSSYRNPEAALLLSSPFEIDGVQVPVVAPHDLEAALRFVEMARSKGFRVSLNVGPVNPPVPGHPPASCVDITGLHTVDPVAWGCPNNPWLIQYGERLVQEMVSTWPAFDMLDLNHLEYPHWCDKGLAEFFVCFCDWCRRRAEEEGLDFERIRRDVSSLYEYLATPANASPSRPTEISANTVLGYMVSRPGLAEWLSFRMSSMSDFIRHVTAASRDAARRHKPDLRIGMSPQLASVSTLVGTDVDGLHSIFDWIAPKFPDYIPGAALPRMAKAVESGSGRWTEAELMPLMRELFGLGQGPDEYVPDEPSDEGQVYSNAFDASFIDGQMKQLQAVKGSLPLYPWIWFHYQDLEALRQKMNAVKANGFDGYFLWAWERNVTTEALKAASGIF